MNILANPRGCSHAGQQPGATPTTATFITLDGASKAIVAIGTRIDLVAQLLTGERPAQWRFTQEMGAGKARELAAALLLAADAAGVQS